MSITSTTDTATSNTAATCTSIDTPGWLALPAGIAGEVDQLRCGTVFLTVPLRHGVIQVGSTGPLPTAKIEVRTSQWAITVRRTDGNDLQAQIVRRAGDAPPSRADVFAEPVAALQIRRQIQSDGTHSWFVASGGPQRASADLFQLIKTIVAFSVAKQGDRAHREKLPASA